MVCSMTGYGQSSAEARGFRVQIEMKSVNHRYLEISVRLSREWLALEEAVKREVQHVIRRGRVDVYVTVEREAGEGKIAVINWPLAEAYRQAADELREKLKLSGSLSISDLLQIPDVIVFRDAEESGSIVEQLTASCAREAAERLQRMREKEGEFLARDLSGRLERLNQLYADICSAAPLVAEEYRNRLAQRIGEWLAESAVIDPADPRIAMEAALMAERADISEELTRLASHFEQCRHLLGSEEAIGRKLDFLIQEMNREVNTIASKANRLEISKQIVEMKAELEKMREQAQNIE